MYGLRAAEPCHLLIEHWQREDRVLTVTCEPQLDYKTKGRVDKSFPVPGLLHEVLTWAAGRRRGGPLFLRRVHFEGASLPASTPGTKQALIDEYQRRVSGNASAWQRLQVARSVLIDAGAVTYVDLSREFRKVVGRADLGQPVTLKALRHHFAGALEIANVSYFTRKYVMGHRVPRDPLAVYTTTGFDQVRREFDRVLRGPMAPVLEAAGQQMERLSPSEVFPPQSPKPRA